MYAARIARTILPSIYLHTHAVSVRFPREKCAAGTNGVGRLPRSLYDLHRAPTCFFRIFLPAIFQRYKCAYIRKDYAAENLDPRIIRGYV